MNWGYRIAIFFTAFVCFMLFMVYKCVQTDFDLVAPDYYAQELVYQEQITKLENTEQLLQKPSWKIEEDGFYLYVPTAVNNGKLVFFRPSDDNLDFELPLELDEKRMQKVPKDKFQRGMYQIQLSWSDQSKDYYLQEKIRIP